MRGNESCIFIILECVGHQVPLLLDPGEGRGSFGPAWGPFRPSQGPSALRVIPKLKLLSWQKLLPLPQLGKIYLKFYCLILRLYSIKSVKGLLSISASLWLEIVIKNHDVFNIFQLKFWLPEIQWYHLQFILSYLRDQYDYLDTLHIKILPLILFLQVEMHDFPIYYGVVVV